MLSFLLFSSHTLLPPHTTLLCSPPSPLNMAPLTLSFSHLSHSYVCDVASSLALHSLPPTRLHTSFSSLDHLFYQIDVLPTISFPLLIIFSPKLARRSSF